MPDCHESPQARLILHAIDKDAGRATVLQRYERAGIDLTRVDWLPVLPRTRLLALYHLADVVLDSYYASGCTTSREALEVSTPRSRRDRAEIAPRSRRRARPHTSRHTSRGTHSLPPALRAPTHRAHTPGGGSRCDAARPVPRLSLDRRVLLDHRYVLLNDSRHNSYTPCFAPLLRHVLTHSYFCATRRR